MTADERYLLMLFRKCDQRGKNMVLSCSRVQADLSEEYREETCFLDTTTKKHVTEDGRQKTEDLGFIIDKFMKKW